MVQGGTQRKSRLLEIRSRVDLMPHADINGARLWFDVRGTGEPLLLHHGYTASRVNWLPVADRLQDRYQIIDGFFVNVLLV